MIRWACFGFLACLGCASTSSSYPLHLHHDPGGGAAAAAYVRKSAFEHRNPQQWSSYSEVNGYVATALTVDPELVSADLDHLRAFARRNADLFGMNAADADRMTPTPQGAEVIDRIGSALIGKLVLRRSLHSPALIVEARFWIHVSLNVEEGALVKQLVGRHYTVTTSTRVMPELDCYMVPGGCQSHESPPLSVRDFEVEATDVVVDTSLVWWDGVVRIIRCASLREGPRLPKPTGAVDMAITPRGNAPSLPLVLDAVTGERVTGVGCSRFSSGEAAIGD